MSRRIAEHFAAFVDELDRRAGFDEAEETENPCAAFGRVIESHSRLMKISLNGCDNPENLPEALERARTLKTYVIQLEGCLERNIQLHAENERNWNAGIGAERKRNNSTGKKGNHLSPVKSNKEKKR